jgi:hypothetical protein
LPASGGYVWSFSGDATLIDPSGLIDGLTQSVARVSGTIGHTGGTIGLIPTLGSATGQVRIREDDDMEILQLLGIL